MVRLIWNFRVPRSILAPCLWFVAVPALFGFSAQLNLQSAANLPVGSHVRWSASTDSTDSGIQYRFRIRPTGGQYSTYRDFASYSNQFDWAPMQDGSFEVEVTAFDPLNSSTAATSQSYSVSTRIAGGTPVVSATDNSLLALYSAPPCVSGSVRVNFWPTANPSAKTATRSLGCTAGKSLNFWIAGMEANTAYSLQQQFVSGWSILNGPVLSFQSGSVPPGIPAATVVRSQTGSSSTAEQIILESNLAIGGPFSSPVARDLQGNVIWYYDAANRDPMDYLLRPLTGGTLLVLPTPGGGPRLEQILREIDLDGNTVGETNSTRLSAQLQALGFSAITSVNHDAIRLPNGYTAVIASNERILTDIQGPGPIDVVGNEIVVLDQNWQVVWAWDAFAHLDTSRKATLNDDCSGGGCSPLTLAPTANDWLHGNSLAYLKDGAFLFSVRSQDWVIKINYANGAGDGRVLWRLGKGGDFTLGASSDPYPWFSHQHNALQIGNRIILFDDGNTRIAQFPGQHSRGQTYLIDETHFTATPELSADLGYYSLALGSAEPLANGNYHFLAGFNNPGPAAFAQSVEVLPNGTLDYTLQIAGAVYRSFRLKDLYNFAY